MSDDTTDELFRARIGKTPPDSFGDLDLAVFPTDITNDEGDEVSDNLARAGFAAVGVRAFAERVLNGDPAGEDFETIIGDLQGDLMHLCDALRLDFDGLVERGRGHYEAELRGEF